MAELIAPAAVPSDGWTVDTLKEFYEAQHAADQRLQSEVDRRYSEVKAAEEKALHVKEVADAEALRLAREGQIYKDLQADKLREQIGSEKGVYATKADLVDAIQEVMNKLTPVIAYVNNEKGHAGGLNSGWVFIGGAAMLITNVVAIIAFLGQ